MEIVRQLTYANVTELNAQRFDRYWKSAIKNEYLFALNLIKELIIALELLCTDDVFA